MRRPSGQVHGLILGAGHLFGKDLSEGALQPSGLLGAIIGAFIALAVYRTALSRRGRHGLA